MITKILLILVVVQSISENAYGQRNTRFFRKDYNYLEATQSFYKLHTHERTWLEAKKTCAREGAGLFYPEDQNEADAVLYNLNQSHNFIYNYVYIGISDLVAETVYETVDGRSVLDVYNNWGDGEPDNANGEEHCVILRQDSTLSDISCSRTSAFICRKTLASLEWNQKCDSPYLDYIFEEKSGRCYKFHSTPMNWTEAHAVCASELSYLAVIDTQHEAEFLIALTEQAPKNKLGTFVRGAVLLGFHDQFDEGWTTVKGTSLEVSGYYCWANQQPDGGDRERCGSMFYNGRLNDIACGERAFFICEHEVNLLENSLNDRFGDDQ